MWTKSKEIPEDIRAYMKEIGLPDADNLYVLTNTTTEEKYLVRKYLNMMNMVMHIVLESRVGEEIRLLNLSQEFTHEMNDGYYYMPILVVRKPKMIFSTN